MNDIRSGLDMAELASSLVFRAEIILMNTELHKAIEQLYNVFAKYPANSSMGGSPLYPDLKEWNRALTSRPLRELSAEKDLRVFYFKAMSTWGNTGDFKHFLPRILELLTTLPPDFEEWVALEKLNYGNYESWPKSEKKAVHQFLLAFWQKLLTEKSSLIDALFEGYFPAIANVHPDFSQLLQLWLENDTQQATQRLAAFVCRNAEQILRKRVLPGFYASPSHGAILFEWLHKAPVVIRLRQAISSEAYPYLDSEVASVISQLEKP